MSKFGASPPIKVIIVALNFLIYFAIIASSNFSISKFISSKFISTNIGSASKCLTVSGKFTKRVYRH